MAHDTQYCSFKYILGTEYSAKTEASEISPVSLQSVLCFHSCDSCARLFLHQRTNGSGFDHVSYRESLDRLVLGCASRAVGASDRLDVATAFLVTSAKVVLVHVWGLLLVAFSYLDARFFTMIAVCVVSKSLGLAEGESEVESLRSSVSILN